MPNHCHNDLYLRGPKADVAACLALIGADQDDPKFDFSAVIPYPERLAQMDAECRAIRSAAPEERAAMLEAYDGKWGTHSDGFNSGGYEWCVEHWGTKWGAYNVARRDYDGPCVTFQTAWSPSKQIVVALAKRFQTITFALEYFERGMQVCGGFTCPAEDEFYEDEGEWEPGVITSEWGSKEYGGIRGC